MDIGNLPIFSGSKDKHTTSSNEAPATDNRSRSFDGNKKQANNSEEKNAWEQIGDYDQPAAAAASSDANNHVDEDEDEEDHEQVQIPRKHTPQQTKDSKKESDDAASIASEAAVKATQQHHG